MTESTKNSDYELRGNYSLMSIDIHTAMSVGLAVSLLQQSYEIGKKLRGNNNECARLLERCRLFEPLLQQIQANPNLYKSSSEPAYRALVDNLQEVLAFVRKFQEPTAYRSLLRFAYRKKYAQELARLNMLITTSASDLELISNIDFEMRRREDIEVRNVLSS